jgi:hypothetical protein
MPLPTAEEPGFTAIEVGIFTMIAEEPLIAPTVAVIVAVPAETAVVTPYVPRLLPTVTTLAADVLHCTALVTLDCVPSVYVAVAVSFCVEPTGMINVLGYTLFG